jgi:hypothetical protein
MFITSALLYTSSVLLSSVFLKLTFLFFAGIFQLTPPPSLPLAYPPPPSSIHAAPIRPKKRKKQGSLHRPNTIYHNTAVNPIKTHLRVKHKNNRPGIAPGRRSLIQFQYFNQDLNRQQKQ